MGRINASRKTRGAFFLNIRCVCASCRAKELGRPMAVYEIAEDLKQLTDTPDFE